MLLLFNFLAHSQTQILLHPKSVLYQDTLSLIAGTGFQKMHMAAYLYQLTIMLLTRM